MDEIRYIVRHVWTPVGIWAVLLFIFLKAFFTNVFKEINKKTKNGNTNK